MHKKVTVDVAAFSLTPGGRYRSEGEFSGEEFREDHLVPVLDSGADIEVDLDGPVGVTSSFLEEVFGGLVRKYGPGIQGRVLPVARARPSRAERARELMKRAVRAT